MTIPTVGSKWRDDDSRVRRGERPQRTLEVLRVGPTRAAVRWIETGALSDLQLSRFGRAGRLLPLGAPTSPPIPSLVPIRNQTHPMLAAVEAILAREANQPGDWQALVVLIPKAIQEARHDERWQCLAEVEQSFTVRGAAEYIRRGIPSRRSI